MKKNDPKWSRNTTKKIPKKWLDKNLLTKINKHLNKHYFTVPDALTLRALTLRFLTN